MNGRSVRRWSLEAQERELLHTTCLNDDVARAGVVHLPAFLPFLRVPARAAGSGAPRP